MSAEPPRSQQRGSILHSRTSVVLVLRRDRTDVPSDGKNAVAGESCQVMKRRILYVVPQDHVQHGGRSGSV